MEWTENDQKLYESIVHGLRSAGWSRHDAMEEADRQTQRTRPPDLAFPKSKRNHMQEKTDERRKGSG